MRLWSIHPAYLDTKGLVALWREALLAQAVLNNKTCGYRHHPQLQRFKQHSNPKGAIASYLRAIYTEAKSRGYNFDKTRILSGHTRRSIPVTNKQLEYEINHLRQKLKQRGSDLFLHTNITRDLKPHPSFEIQQGPIASWEKRPT